MHKVIENILPFFLRLYPKHLHLRKSYGYIVWTPLCILTGKNILKNAHPTKTVYPLIGDAILPIRNIVLLMKTRMRPRKKNFS